MTTLVATRQPLEVLSMNKQAGRRTSKRNAATSDFERDDDFQFVRKAKKAKTEEAEPVKEPVKKARGRPAATKAKEPTIIEDEETFYTKKSTAPAQRTTRRKASPDPVFDEPQPKVPKRTTRKSARGVSTDDLPAPPAPPAPSAEPRQSNKAVDDEPRVNGGATRKAPTKKGKPTRAAKLASEEPSHEEPSAVSSSSKTIALPMSDTPIINRNKEMRKKGGGGRRSSLGSRGRRASSLIESGQTAIPHREVDPAEFYKHIEADGLPEPRRMKQLLTWCGERSLGEKPPHGTPNLGAILGARAIQDQLLKDFGLRSDFSNWFDRDDSTPTATKPVTLQPNPRNLELDEKMAQLEAKVKRLQEEKKAWLAIQKPPPEQPQLFPDEPSSSTSTHDHIILPDFDLLDPEEHPIRTALADETATFAALRQRTASRLRTVQKSLEFQVDQLADNVHKLEQRVSIAGREADEVLKLSSLRLREREEREKLRTRTKEMPLMEVLRSLSNILPEGGG